MEWEKKKTMYAHACAFGEEPFDAGVFCIAPTIGTYMYAENFNEKQKMAHRY